MRHQHQKQKRVRQMLRFLTSSASRKPDATFPQRVSFRESQTQQIQNNTERRTRHANNSQNLSASRTKHTQGRNNPVQGNPSLRLNKMLLLSWKIVSTWIFRKMSKTFRNMKVIRSRDVREPGKVMCGSPQPAHRVTYPG